MSSNDFEPRIVGFFCNWCSYRAADLAGTSRIKYQPNVRIIRVMCSGRVDPTFVLKALALGADGVLIAGCHPGECHYLEQNYKAMRRYSMLKHTLRFFGVEEERIRLQWASAAEGAQLAQAINEMVDQVRELGPLNWSAQWAENGQIEAAIERIAEEHAEAMEVPV
ncbi:MAG: hydrogenase iron-sulfur subunit [Anaerolineales bacterium]|nr:hydrogenase iron-sulfur subunit [Anaerolineales bacterium]